MIKINDFKDRLETIIKNNDLEEFKNLFCDEHITDYINYSLEYAAYHGNLKVIKYLLNNYSNKIYNITMNSSLEDACIHGHLNIIKYILKNYLDKVSNISINYYLQYAALYGHSGIFKYILKNYEREITDYSLNKCLKSASELNYLYIVKCIKYCQFVKENNTTYKNIVIFNF